MSEYNIRKITTKKIFIRDDYISLAKSFMSLPIFNATNKKPSESDFLTIETRDLFQYKNIRIATPLLSLNFDFNILLFLIKEAVVAEDKNVIFIEYSKLFKFLKVSSTNSPLYRTKTKDTFSKLQMFSMRFEKGGREYLLGFVGDVIEVEGGLSVTVSMGLKIFYEADRDLIFNLEVERFNKLKSSFARALFLFYKSNNYKKTNTFKIQDLIYRLQCSDNDSKEVNRNLKRAHDELVKSGLIHSVREIKDVVNKRKTVKFAVVVNIATDKETEEQQTETVEKVKSTASDIRAKAKSDEDFMFFAEDDTMFN
ncbi:hypothetical protein CFII64_24074 [Pseudomonas sp. CFII64]|uniref:hypothetical protein n=1 Tax=Pseudomonas sp. CFII64 TaxID=911242 RepID=UPI0003579EAB|nr:hypothetical protein [Pseudomonas sp. CFII64]EPJ77221.1 hypothetical protein CFII64_24074 [Pseudomonas sp. CFII64]